MQLVEPCDRRPLAGHRRRPSRGTWIADSDVTLTGMSSGNLGTLSLTHGNGTLTFQGASADAFYVTSSQVPSVIESDAGADAGPDPRVQLSWDSVRRSVGFVLG